MKDAVESECAGHGGGGIAVRALADNLPQSSQNSDIGYRDIRVRKPKGPQELREQDTPHTLVINIRAYAVRNIDIWLLY